MSDPQQVESRIERLEYLMAIHEDVEAIKRLKYRYWRCLDSKLWGDLAGCFTQDAAASYVYTRHAGGKYDCLGRDAIMAFLRKVLDRNTRISMHQGHHPEIEITSDTTAKAVWQLQDYLIDTGTNTSVWGVSFYYDEYVKVDGEWKIKSIGSCRVFEEMWDTGEIKSLKLTANMFAQHDK